MTRSIPEWIAKHDDEAIPPRVKLRIFEKYNERCPNCTLKIVGKLLPAYDHITAIINGGEHRESNIQLLCVPCHKLKTQTDVAKKSATYHSRLKAARIRKQTRRRTMPGRKFDGTPIPPRWVNS